MRVPKDLLRQGQKRERSMASHHAWINNTNTRPNSSAIEIQISDNSSSLTINITLENDQEARNISQPGVFFTPALVMTSSGLDSTSSSMVPTVPTSLPTVPTATLNTSTLSGSAPDNLVSSTPTGTFGAETLSTLSATSPPPTSLAPGLVYASPFTNASVGSSVPLVVVILRTLFG